MNDIKFHKRADLLPVEGCGSCVKLRVKRL